MNEITVQGKTMTRVELQGFLRKNGFETEARSLQSAANEFKNNKNGRGMAVTVMQSKARLEKAIQAGLDKLDSAGLR